MRVLNFVLGFFIFHLQFVLVEFFIGYFVFAGYITLIGDQMFQGVLGLIDRGWRMGIILMIVQLEIRSVFGNFIAYYFLFKWKLNWWLTYVLSLIIALIIYLACILWGGEITHLAWMLLEVKSFTISVFGGIAIANFVMLKMRK